MKSQGKEVLFYYNPQSSKDRMTLAYAKSVSKYVRAYSHQQANVSSTRWKDLLDKLGLEPKKLFNKALPAYQELIKGLELDDEGWLNVLKRNPDLIKSPIAIRGKRAILCESPTDILKLSM